MVVSVCHNEYMNTNSRTKLLYIAGVLGIFSVVGILLWTIIADSKDAVITIFSQPTPTPISQKISRENLARANLNLVFVSPTSVAVFLDPKEELISAVQLQLKYDPNVLTDVDIIPGTLFPRPVVLTKKIDPEKGTIFYVIGVSLESNNPVVSKGTVATISFVRKSTEKTKISFLPLTKVTSFGIDQSILNTATEVEIE